MDLEDTVLLLFGNPEAGTQLMQENRTIAIDLPMKMLVWQDEEGQVRIAYNEPLYLSARHGVTEPREVLEAMENVLDDIARQAAG